MFKYNPFTDKLDKVKSKAEQQIDLDDVYVNEIGDTMTGRLTIDLPSPSLDEIALSVNKRAEFTASGFSEFGGGIKIRAGEKLIFDGDN